ncbi:MAG TPA: hypothetical protein VFQ88_15330 [Nevskiaceae bacterium]|nr:hypothetical protein [Nevskiaceae bacterium]
MDTMMRMAAAHPLIAAGLVGVLALVALWTGMTAAPRAFVGASDAPSTETLSVDGAGLGHPFLVILMLGAGVCGAYLGVHYLVHAEVLFGNGPVVTAQNVTQVNWVKASGDANTQRELDAAM